MEIDATLIEEFKTIDRDSSLFSEKCIQIVQDITTNKITIVQLIEQLGSLLVDKNPQNRELGIWILTKVLQNLPQNFFNETELQFICNFYTDRLKDHHQVIPGVLVGFLALLEAEQFPNGAASNFLNALFQNISCQQQQEQDRNNIYKIFAKTLEKCQTELLQMELNYVYGVISAVDGERNPNNILQLFQWYPKFVTTVKLGHLTEEMFEIMACYFPVDFKASTEDKNKITRNQLASALAPCLTAIPDFAPFCLQLAQEKLESSLEVAKIDALDLIYVACQTPFNQSDINIASLIQKELFNKPKIELEEKCLITLTAVAQKLDLNQIKDICDSIKGNLIPDSLYFDCSAKILHSVATASLECCKLVTGEILPILINSYNITATPQSRARFLKIMIDFHESCQNFKIETDDMKRVEIFCFKATSDCDELKVVAFEGLRRILAPNLKTQIFEQFTEFLLRNETDIVRKEILNCFETFALKFPTEMTDKVIDNYDITDVTILKNFLDAITVIFVHPNFSNDVIKIFLYYLNKNLAFSSIVLNAFETVLRNFENSQSVHRENNTVTSITDWFIQNESNLNLNCLKPLPIILKTIIGNATIDVQRKILDTVLPKFQPLNVKRIFIWDGILCRLQHEIQIDYQILNQLNEFVDYDDSLIANVTCQLLANLINKCNDEIVVKTYLNSIKSNNLILISWITKALIMKNHPVSNAWIEKILVLLQTNNNVANCFKIILSQSDCLNVKSYCYRNLFYRQKFFTSVTNTLCESYTDDKSSFLLAFGYLIQGVPKQVVLLQFKKILKLIFLTLDKCPEPDILTVILELIKDLIESKENVIEDHLSEFLDRFLNLSTFQKSMQVRILSLKCLQHSTQSFPVFKLILHKQKVLQVLGKAIDDKKRLVRKEAVEARSLWFLIDSPQ